MSDQGPWVTKTILELEERVAELTEEIEHLQDSLIRQGKMLSAIVNITKGPPEENSWHSTHDAVESVERLQARVADLEQAASVSEWIKCSERLPAERCLAFTPSDHPEIRYRIVPERILKALSEATHWMPLPKPPKQEQDDE